jgi:hypothetical protein
MIDPELKSHLELIEKKLGGGWYSFRSGILGGIGYVIGAALAILLIGWILNIIGVIPAFKSEVNQLQSLLKQVNQRDYLPASNAQSQSR